MNSSSNSNTSNITTLHCSELENMWDSITASSKSWNIYLVTNISLLFLYPYHHILHGQVLTLDLPNLELTQDGKAVNILWKYCKANEKPAANWDKRLQLKKTSPLFFCLNAAV